mmetsp:Transcript_52937/g.123950  ORF Transcript_52937/g.123950 Transcript_52937/m.123950 type:complete len:205 (-) Transcript_52937:554-1168(-)
MAMMLVDHGCTLEHHEGFCHKPILLIKAQVCADVHVVRQLAWSSAECAHATTEVVMDGDTRVSALSSEVLRLATVDDRPSHTHAQVVDHLLRDVLCAVVLVGPERKVTHLTDVEAADAVLKQTRIFTHSIFTISLTVLVVSAAHRAAPCEEENVEETGPMNQNVEEDRWVQVASSTTPRAFVPRRRCLAGRVVKCRAIVVNLKS